MFSVTSRTCQPTAYDAALWLTAFRRPVVWLWSAVLHADAPTRWKYEPCPDETDEQVVDISQSVGSRSLMTIRWSPATENNNICCQVSITHLLPTQRPWTARMTCIPQWLRPCRTPHIIVYKSILKSVHHYQYHRQLALNGQTLTANKTSTISWMGHCAISSHNAGIGHSARGTVFQKFKFLHKINTWISHGHPHYSLFFSSK